MSIAIPRIAMTYPRKVPRRLNGSREGSVNFRMNAIMRPTPVRGCLAEPISLRPTRGRLLYREKHIQQIDIYQNCDCHDAVCPGALHQLQIDQYPGEAKSDDPRIKAHAYSAKRFGIQPAYEIRANRYSNYNAGDQHK